MDFTPEGAIAKLFEVSALLGVLGIIAWLLWKAYFDGNNKRIEEIKENNKILTEAFQRETDAKYALANATNKQTEIMEDQVEATKLLENRLQKVELSLEGLKAK